MFIPNYVFFLLYDYDEYAVLHATYAYASSGYLSVILSFFIANTATALISYFTHCWLKSIVVAVARSYVWYVCNFFIARLTSLNCTYGN